MASAERGEAGLPPCFGESSGVPLTAPSSESPAGGRSCGSALCKLKGAGLSGEGERALSSSSASSVIAPAAVTRGPTQAVLALYVRQLPLDRDWQACARAEGGRDGSGRRLRPSPATFHEVQPSALCARGTTCRAEGGEKEARFVGVAMCAVRGSDLPIGYCPCTCQLLEDGKLDQCGLKNPLNDDALVPQPLRDHSLADLRRLADLALAMGTRRSNTPQRVSSAAALCLAEWRQTNKRP